MSDERILGDSDFVDSVIPRSEEQYERRHQLKRLGYDLDRIAGRVALEMSLAGVGFSVERGESIAKNGNYLLID